MSLKVFHTGDLHLDMLYSSRGYPEEVRQALVEARYRTLERMVEVANREDCHLFVVAGDLFERLGVKEEQVLRATQAFSRFSGLCVVLPGNHDYYTPTGSLWKKFREHAADNLLMLLEPAPYHLGDYGLDAVLYPAPCHAKHSEENRIKWINHLSERPEAKWHLGVAHGSLEGCSPDFQRNYFPMQESELLEAGLHFWFLGHTHVPVPSGENFRNRAYAYCGTPEPDGFDCSHGGSAWITVLEANGGTEGSAVTTGNYCFKDLDRTINSTEDWSELSRELSIDGERTLVRLKLKGTLPREEFENRYKWIEEIKDKLFYLEWDDAHMQMEINREVISQLFPENSFPYLLLKRLADKGDQKSLQMAYALIKEVKN